MAAPYLSSKTEVLSFQQPVEPAQARAAQIPLQDFSLPTFPQEAFTSGTSPSSPPFHPLFTLPPGGSISDFWTLRTPTSESEADNKTGLESLILTSDIKLDEYTALLSQPFSVPELPHSITSLTLELFSLGYPPGFLSELGRQLKGLKTLTLYSQLFAGTTVSCSYILRKAQEEKSFSSFIFVIP